MFQRGGPPGQAGRRTGDVRPGQSCIVRHAGCMRAAYCWPQAKPGRCGARHVPHGGSVRVRTSGPSCPPVGQARVDSRRSTADARFATAPPLGSGQPLAHAASAASPSNKRARCGAAADPDPLQAVVRPRCDPPHSATRPASPTRPASCVSASVLSLTMHPARLSSGLLRSSSSEAGPRATFIHPTR